MNPFVHHLLAALAGALSGLASAVPVGPVNVTIINEAARHGRNRAWWVGCGAGTMEMVFCALGFLGAAPLLTAPRLQSLLQLLGMLVIAGLGWHYLTTPTVPGIGLRRVARRQLYQPHAAFALGFVRVLGNPGVLVYWVAVATSFAAHGVVGSDGRGRTACLAGVALATYGWFGLLGWLAAQVHGRISSSWLLRLSRFSGALLLVVAAALGGRLLWGWLTR